MAAKKSKPVKPKNPNPDGQGEVYSFPPEDVKSSPEQNEVVFMIMKVYRLTKDMPTDELQALYETVQEHGVLHPDGSHANTFVEAILREAVEAWT